MKVECPKILDRGVEFDNTKKSETKRESPAQGNNQLSNGKNVRTSAKRMKGIQIVETSSMALSDQPIQTVQKHKNQPKTSQDQQNSDQQGRLVQDQQGRQNQGQEQHGRQNQGHDQQGRQNQSQDLQGRQNQAGQDQQGRQSQGSEQQMRQNQGQQARQSQGREQASGKERQQQQGSKRSQQGGNKKDKDKEKEKEKEKEAVDQSHLRIDSMTVRNRSTWKQGKNNDRDAKAVSESKRSSISVSVLFAKS